MSMAMTNSGHITHAKAIADLSFHLAWGKLPAAYADPWNLGEVPPTSVSKVVTADVFRLVEDNFDTLPNTDVIKVISVTQGGVQYTIGVDCTIDGNKITWVGATRPIPSSTYKVTYRFITDEIESLLEELGRRNPTRIKFVKEDAFGDITANNLKWSISDEPTRNLYLEFKFDATDAVGQVIHQVGMFIGTTRKAGIEPDKMYLLPDEIEDPGYMYMVDNLEPFSRFSGKREVFEYIITY